MPSPSFRPYLVATACSSFITLTYELLAARVLASLYFNHVVYLAISSAFLGFALSGLVAGQKKISKETVLKIALFLIPLSLPLFMILASRGPLLEPYLGAIGSIAWSLGALVIPFLILGAAVSSSYGVAPILPSKIFVADVGAAALGVAAFLFFLTPLGAENLIWLLSVVGTLPLVFRVRQNPMAQRVLSGQVLCLLVLFFSFRGNLISPTPASYKFGGGQDAHQTEIEETVWTPLTKLEVLTRSFERQYGIGKEITQDREAYTMLSSTGKAKAFLDSQRQRLHPEVAELVYTVHPKPEKVLVIGVGGGNDLLMAMAAGSQKITGVEINKSMVQLVTQKYAAAAPWFRDPRVEIINSEGRRYLASHSDKFDVLTLYGTDTLTASNTGAYVLTESYLYTVDACRAFLEHLKPQGVASVVRWLFKEPRETIRLAHLFRQALESMGISRPERKIAVIATDVGWPHYWATTLVKTTDFTPEEIRNLVSTATQKVGGNPLYTVYLPPVLEGEKQKALEAQAFKFEGAKLSHARDVFRKVLTLPKAELDLFVANYPYDISVVTDDRPFFYEYFRLKNLFQTKLSELRLDQMRGPIIYAVLTFGIVLVLLLALALIGFFCTRPENLLGKSLGAEMGSFFFLGLAFGMVEIVLAQVFSLYLGHPSLALGIVLGGLLFFTACGSLFERGTKNLETGLSGIFYSALVVFLLYLFLPQWKQLGSALGFEFRILWTFLPIGLCGFCLGRGYPFLLSHFKTQLPNQLAWAWSLNGLGNVAGSLLAVFCALQIGFQSSLLLVSFALVLGGALQSRHFSKIPFFSTTLPSKMTHSIQTS